MWLWARLRPTRWGLIEDAETPTTMRGIPQARKGLRMFQYPAHGDDLEGNARTWREHTKLRGRASTTAAPGYPDAGIRIVWSGSFGLDRFRIRLKSEGTVRNLTSLIVVMSKEG